MTEVEGVDLSFEDYKTCFVEETSPLPKPVKTSSIVTVFEWSLVKNAIKNAPHNSCIVFDIDDVLIDVDRLNDLKTPYSILDVEVLEVIELIEEREIKAYALTHGGWGNYRGNCLEDLRLEGLRRVGIDFASLSQHLGRFEIPQEDKTYLKAALVINGIIFARNRYFELFCKGKILFEALKQLGECPEHIIFIDDRKCNLEAVQKQCMTHSICFQGFEYLSNKKNPSPNLFSYLFSWLKV